MIQKFFKLLRGFFIIAIFSASSIIIVKSLQIKIPASVIGLILFMLSLLLGIIKEDWIKDSCNILIKNMSLCIVPFVGGVIVYKQLVWENIAVISLVVFIATAFSIVLTGVFVEYGLKYLRLRRIKKHND